MLGTLLLDEISAGHEVQNRILVVSGWGSPLQAEHHQIITFYLEFSEGFHQICSEATGTWVLSPPLPLLILDIVTLECKLMSTSAFQLFQRSC
ncbi:hypothetical protein EJB05_33586 [Eragrostis curvula]|uniref:Uncharacterized protein n=1 Tax=Eragrostis curvula TaxID=38414 RepID=A0A5J9U1G7_9POAL|nr:hypothetical protein EJB05_33586 [Eragrostis curvula]